MSTERVILTYQEYEALPADGRRYELHEGELSVTPAPSPRHQRILRNLNKILQQHVETLGLGEVLFAPLDCILSETTVVQPDLSLCGHAPSLPRERQGYRGTADPGGRDSFTCDYADRPEHQAAALCSVRRPLLLDCGLRGAQR